MSLYNKKAKSQVKKGRKVKINSLKSFYYSKFFIVIGIIILILISISLGKELIRKAEINSEIKLLEAEIQGLESKNTEMGDLIKYLNSSSFLEKEAKERLGLQETDEKVVMMPNDLTKNGIIEIENKEQAEQNISNPTKWKKYFLTN
ncbi:MAG: septum formation initiator family protein [Patescibacteria group bacterium]